MIIVVRKCGLFEGELMENNGNKENKSVKVPFAINALPFAINEFTF